MFKSCHAIFIEIMYTFGKKQKVWKTIFPFKTAVAIWLSIYSNHLMFALLTYPKCIIPIQTEGQVQILATLFLKDQIFLN